jgi:sulfonate transport system ATP-binding protein
MEQIEKKDRKVKVKALNLTKKFGDLLVLDNMTFDVMEGELLCVVGPTGCGKTTFLNSLTNLCHITEGQILVNGVPVDLTKQNIAYIFQEDSTMPWLSVEQNIAFGLATKNLPDSVKKDRVNEYMEIVGLTKYRKYYPRQLSASMLQRVSIARAFATEPELLLMDEPYAQLDIELRYQLEDELVKLWQKTGTTVMFITHNIEEAVYLGERILILTNKPTTVKQFLEDDIPRPRDISSDEFVKLRVQVTDLIKWW